MNVMVLGSGGREHALIWKLAQSQKITQLYAAPGNPGTATLATNIPLKVNDFEAIKSALIANRIEMLVVGPEDPLVGGIKNYCKNQKELEALVVVGPDSAGAQLEGSKDFAKAFMQRNRIPTAAYKSFDHSQYKEACAFLETLPAPYVLKADGLAAGKGVLIPATLDQAKLDLKELMSGKFGHAGDKVVIEEFLKGIEVSVFVLTDGVHYKILPEAKDYKRIGDADTGLNTGGMGAVSPVPFVTSAFMDKVKERIVQPTLNGLKAEGLDYRGFLFLGLMNCQGDPYVIEYNVRMGDPETEAVMLRLDGDLAEALYSLGTQSLDEVALDVKNQTAVTVVAVSGGYPESYPKGMAIIGINQPLDGQLFHMGTAGSVALGASGESSLTTNGGRVLAMTCLGESIEQARANAYEQITKISYRGMYFRKDIGLDLMHNQ